MVLASEGVTPPVGQPGRTRGIAGVIEGDFAVAWFGWAMAAGPGLLSHLLQIGLGLGVLTVIWESCSPCAPEARAHRCGTRPCGDGRDPGWPQVCVARCRRRDAGDQWARKVDTRLDLRRRGHPFHPALPGPWQTVAADLRRPDHRCGRDRPRRGPHFGRGPSTITGAGAGLCLLVSAAITLILKSLYTRRPADTR